MFSNHNASMASRVRLLEFDRDNSRAGTDRPFENLISAAVYLDALFRKNYILYAFTGRFAEKLRDLSHVWAWDIDVVIQAPTARVLNIVGSEERIRIKDKCYDEGLTDDEGLTEFSVETRPKWDDNTAAHIIEVNIIPCGKPASLDQQIVSPQSLEYERDLLSFTLPTPDQKVSFHVVSLRYLMCTMLADRSSRSPEGLVWEILSLMKKYPTEVVTFADKFKSADVDHFLQALPQDSRQEIAVFFGR